MLTYPTEKGDIIMEISKNFEVNSLENSKVRKQLLGVLKESTDYFKRKSNKVVLQNFFGDIYQTYILQDDLNVPNKKTLKDKLIYLKAKIEMRSSKSESYSCSLGLKRLLNVDISEKGQKQYIKSRFLTILKEVESEIISDYDEQSLNVLLKKIDFLKNHLKDITEDIQIYRNNLIKLEMLEQIITENLKQEQIKNNQKTK